MTRPPPTLDRFLLEREPDAAPATRELSQILLRLGVAGKRIARELAVADLRHTRGSAGTENVQGEEQKKLDVRANDILVETFDDGGLVSVVASEEMEVPHVYRKGAGGARYALLFDPMDGSSNIDVDGTLGTIFSIRPRRDGTEADLLRPGTEQVAAGYVLFGPAVLFVYTSGRGTHVFSLDPAIGEFVLVRRNLEMPKKGRGYAVNEGRHAGWAEADRAFVEHLKEADPSSGRPYSTRYSGSMVGDVHRILIEGGIYLYPADTSSGKPSGKIRLLYESHPLAFVVEQAGGRASTGRDRVLDLAPRKLHERIPVAIGSAVEVDLYERFVRGAPT